MLSTKDTHPAFGQRDETQMGNVKLGRNMHYSVTGIVALVGLLGVFGQAALADGDPAAGKTIFAKWSATRPMRA